MTLVTGHVAVRLMFERWIINCGCFELQVVMLFCWQWLYRSLSLLLTGLPPKLMMMYHWSKGSLFWNLKCICSRSKCKTHWTYSMQQNHCLSFVYMIGTLRFENGVVMRLMFVQLYSINGQQQLIISWGLACSCNNIMIVLIWQCVYVCVNVYLQ